MSNKKNVVKFKKRRTINIGIVIFSIMFIYVAIYVYIYFTKDHLSIYEVKDGSITDDKYINGLVLRNEEVFFSKEAGYVSYFQKEGARVAKNSSIYSIDDNRQILDIIISGEEPMELTAENNAQFKYEISSFQKNFSNHNFDFVYNFKEDAKSTALDILSNAMIQQGQTIEENTGFNFSYDIYRSPESGIVSYHVDAFEDITVDNISQDLFNTEDYQPTNLRNLEIISQDSPIYKLIRSEKWAIIIPLTEEQHTKLIEKDSIDFRIIKNNLETSGDLTLYKKANDYYGIIKMDKHLSNYINDRYLEIELHIEAIEGLKIPLTSVVEKDFYLVPLEYFTLGGDSGENGLNKLTFDSETGDVNITFVPTDIYYKDEVYGYLDTRQFESGTWIQITGDTDRYQLNLTDKLTGVYNVNMGYAVFKRIEPLYQSDEYCIVKKGTEYGLSSYDHIALESSTAVEQAIIY